MADNLEVRGLELKIKASSSAAAEEITKLSSAIKGLSFGTSKQKNLDAMASGLVRFSNQLKGAVPSSIAKLSSFADALTKWGQVQEAVSNIKFGKSQVNAFGRLAETLSNMGGALSGVDDSSIAKLNAFAPALNSLADIKKPNIPKDIAQRLAETSNVLSGLDSDTLQTKAQGFAQAMKPLADLKVRLPNIAKFAEGVNSIDISKLATQSLAVSQAVQPLVYTMRDLADSMRAIPSGVVLGAIAKIEKQSTTATPKVNALANALKKLKAFGRSVGNVASGLGRIGGYMLPFRNLGSSVTTAKKKFDTLFSSIKRIAFYRAIRTFIKGVTDGFRIGTENLYYYSQAVGTKFAPAMDLLATDLLYFRNSIGAAASPLIEKLAPAVDYATDRIVDMINAVNMLFAKLTGKSQWTKALKYPAQYAEETKNSAKAAKDYLLEFDELHVLNDDAGGRGADALDYSRMFEEKQLNQSFATWVDDFKDAIQNGDWYGAGEVLGDQIDTAIKSIDAISLADSLTDKVNDVVDFSRGFLDRLDTYWYGQELADFLNECIEDIDEYELGDLMGERVQKVIEFGFGFAYKFDWEGLGLGINDFLEGYFEAIDGEMLGSTTSGLFNGVLTTLKTVFTDMTLSDAISTDIAGFFNGIDWEKTIYNTLTTAGSLLHWISTTFVDTVAKIEWSEVATAIGKGLRQAVSEIDWAGIWDNINTLFNAAANFTFDMTQEWGYDIGKNISIALNNGYYDWKTGEWVDLTEQLYDEGGTYQAQLFDAILSGDVTSVPSALFQDASHILEYYAGQGSLSSTADEESLAHAAEVIEQLGEDFNPWTLHIGTGYQFNAMEGGLFTNQFIDDFLERTGLGNLTQAHLEGIASGSLGLPSGVNLSEEDLQILQSILGKTDTTVKNSSRNIKTASKTWKEYAQAIQGVSTDSKDLSATTTDMDATISKIGEPIKSAQTAFSNLKDNGIKSFGELNNGLSTPLANIKSKIITAFGGAKDSVATTMTTTKNSVVNAVKGVNNDLTTPLNNIKSKIVNAFKDTNKQLNTPITNIRQRPTNAINGAITDLATPLSNIKKVITNTFKTVNSTSISYLTGKDTGLHDKTVKAFENTNTDLQTPVSTIKDTVVNGFMGVINNLKSHDFVGNATGLWRDVKNNIIPIGNSILTAGELIANGMNAAFTNLSNKIGGYKLSLPKEFGGGTISFNFPKSSDISVPRIPAMATGGLVTSPTTALIGEAGREAVMPLDSNTEWMDMLASRLVVGMANGATDANERPIQVHVTLDGREIYQNQEKVRRSIGYNVGGGAFA